MHQSTQLYLKQLPFMRLVVCLIAGILLQWYLQFSLSTLFITGGVIVAALLFTLLLPHRLIFSLQWLRGVTILLLFVVAGGIAVYVKDIRNNLQYVGTYYKPSQAVLLTIDEPLVDKANSYKALATVTAVQQGRQWKTVKGDVLLYFYKGKSAPRLHYGSQIILHAPLQPIKNSGNPGTFDYKQYCLFHDIVYQSFVYPGQYTMLWQDGGNSLQRTLFNVRDATIAALQKTIPRDKEQAVAEALLIGYRDKLDPDLVQAYTNTGVIHIIAISGMHLGMIYLLLLAIFSRLPGTKTTRIVEAVVVIFVLWLFSFLAGAVPSITRAAVMFSVMAVGKLISRQARPYNTLAASAFILLMYDPFYLWDAGFMLSYSAVLSIMAFFKPIYNWFYVKNKVLDFLWKGMAVNIAAQILTLPVILLYFHQFANTFLLSNLLAVPLSEIILYAEIVLLFVVLIPVVAGWLGIAVYGLIIALNWFINWVSHLPFALWDNIYADIPQTLLLYVFILAVCYWLLRKAAKALTASVALLACLVIYTSIRYIGINHTQKLVVYNVPHQTAIDVMQGGNYRFIGDSALLLDGKLVRYNLKPCRIMNGVSPAGDTLLSPSIQNRCLSVNHTKILVLDNNFRFGDSLFKVPVDVIILTKNPKYSIQDIAGAFSFKQLVFDGSNTMLKIRRWKKDCDSLHLRFHSVPEQGAFEMNL